jgi:hypothetical protein
MADSSLVATASKPFMPSRCPFHHSYYAKSEPQQLTKAFGFSLILSLERCPNFFDSVSICGPSNSDTNHDPLVNASGTILINLVVLHAPIGDDRFSLERCPNFDSVSVLWPIRVLTMTSCLSLPVRLHVDRIDRVNYLELNIAYAAHLLDVVDAHPELRLSAPRCVSPQSRYYRYSTVPVPGRVAAGDRLPFLEASKQAQSSTSNVHHYI